MTLAQTVATHTANEHLNTRCMHMEMQAKLLRWQEVYDSTLAALVYFEQALQEQHREALAYVSEN